MLTYSLSILNVGYMECGEASRPENGDDITSGFVGFPGKVHRPYVRITLVRETWLWGRGTARDEDNCLELAVTQAALSL